MNIEELRTKIDKIDTDILNLLNQRMDIVHEIGLIKSASNESVYRPEREKEIIDRLNTLSEGKLNVESIKAIFQEVFAAARNIELPERISYLGPEGSFTHQAAENNFGSQAKYLPINSIKSVFNSVESKKTKYAIIPLENNQEGIVQETVDLLGVSNLKIISELPMSISFSFATRAKDINKIIEWQRINGALKKIKKLNKFISLDTRKSWIMEKGIQNKVNLINDVSGLQYDSNSTNVLKKHNIPFVIHHMQGTPKNMQKNPKYKNVLLDIYDFFENKIKEIRNLGIKHNNIILDPGIGFGKNLKHNMTLINNISVFHTLGFPVMLGVSRKRFIRDLSGDNDSKERLGGTISSSLYAMMQGVQILRIHNVNEVNQSIKVFKSLNFK